MANVYGKLVADFEVNLTAAVAIGAETATISSATDDDGVAVPTGKYYLTIDRDNSAKEYIYCTLTSTALTAIKSISRQGASTTGFAKAHRIGAKVSLTDWGTLKAMNDVLSGAVGFDGSAPLTYDTDPTITDDKHIATKKYIDDVALVSAPKATEAVFGVTKLSVAAVSSVEPIAVGDNDNRVPPVDTSSVTADIVAALAGTGTPNGTTGKYVTADDVSDAASSGKIVRATGTALPALSAENLTSIPLTTIAILSASNNLKYSADTERTTTGNTNFNKLKSIRINTGGVIRVKFDLNGEYSGTHYYGQIYVNGVAVGTLQAVLNATYTTFSEDIYVPPFGIVDLYVKTENSAQTAYCRNFRIYYDKGTTTDMGVVITD